MDQLKNIIENNTKTLQHIKDFVILIDKIEESINMNIDKIIKANNESKNKMDENLELYFKICRDLVE